MIVELTSLKEELISNEQTGILVEFTVTHDDASQTKHNHSLSTEEIEAYQLDPQSLRSTLLYKAVVLHSVVLRKDEPVYVEGPHPPILISQADIDAELIRIQESLPKPINESELEAPIELEAPTSPETVPEEG